MSKKWDKDKAIISTGFSGPPEWNMLQQIWTLVKIGSKVIRRN